MAYIYLIKNNVNNKVYVGKTEISIAKRFQGHIRDSRRERCKNRPLYRAMNKYGVENFTVSMIEETDRPEDREIFWIAFYDSYKNGYNATLGGDGKKYLDYDLIVSTYKILHNARQTASVLGISDDTVEKVIKQRGRLLSSAEVSRNENAKTIYMIGSDGCIEKEFFALRDAAKFLLKCNLARGSIGGIADHISQCAYGKRKSAYGKTWQWKQ